MTAYDVQDIKKYLKAGKNKIALPIQRSETGLMVDLALAEKHDMIKKERRAEKSMKRRHNK